MNPLVSGGEKCASLADALFTTTQQRVLGYLFGQPERSFFATELIKLAGGGSGGVQRELALLAERIKAAFAFGSVARRKDTEDDLA